MYTHRCDSNIFWVLLPSRENCPWVCKNVLCTIYTYRERERAEQNLELFTGDQADYVTSEGQYWCRQISSILIHWKQHLLTIHNTRDRPDLCYTIHSIAKIGSRLLLAVVSQVHSQDSPCGICGGPGSTGVYLQNSLIFSTNRHSKNATHYQYSRL